MTLKEDAQMVSVKGTAVVPNVVVKEEEAKEEGLGGEEKKEPGDEGDEVGVQKSGGTWRKSFEETFPPQHLRSSKNDSCSGDDPIASPPPPGVVLLPEGSLDRVPEDEEAEAHEGQQEGGVAVGGPRPLLVQPERRGGGGGEGEHRHSASR